MTQYLRPLFDISVGVWTTSPLYDKIDEDPYSDTDYISSLENNTGQCDVGYSEPDPGSISSSGTHTWRFRYKRTGTRAISLVAALMCGSTTVKSVTLSCTDSWQQADYALTSGEIANITNYNQLSVRLNPSAAVRSTTINVSWTVLEVPDSVGSKNHHIIAGDYPRRSKYPGPISRNASHKVNLASDDRVLYWLRADDQTSKATYISAGRASGWRDGGPNGYDLNTYYTNKPYYYENVSYFNYKPGYYFPNTNSARYVLARSPNNTQTNGLNRYGFIWAMVFYPETSSGDEPYSTWYDRLVFNRGYPALERQCGASYGPYTVSIVNLATAQTYCLFWEYGQPNRSGEMERLSVVRKNGAPWSVMPWDDSMTYDGSGTSTDYRRRLGGTEYTISGTCSDKMYIAEYVMLSGRFSWEWRRKLELYLLTKYGISFSRGSFV